MRTKLRHTLVQYQGGGYDGCYWEWNYFYIDADGEFHNIEATGRDGCVTVDDADILLADADSSTYTYDVLDGKQVEAFSRESNPAHVLGVLRWFNDYNAHKADPVVQFFACCAVCNQPIDADDAETIENDLLCSDCFTSGTCFVCGKYVGASDFENDLPCSDCCISGTCFVCGENLGASGFDYETAQEELTAWDDDNGSACRWCWEHQRGR